MYKFELVDWVDDVSNNGSKHIVRINSGALMIANREDQQFRLALLPWKCSHQLICHSLMLRKGGGVQSQLQHDHWLVVLLSSSYRAPQFLLPAGRQSLAAQHGSCLSTSFPFFPPTCRKAKPCSTARFLSATLSQHARRMKATPMLSSRSGSSGQKR